jgi:glycosyltransferase involved in cell wall biosynthesis
MPSAPRLSIVSPMYNSGKFLAATIESILAQTMRDFELVLSDDGSTDNTLEIADRFAARDQRVKVVRNVHRGIAATRNSGLQASDRRSEFITLFDSDDIWEPHAAATLMAALDANPHAPAAHCVCRCIDDNGVQFPDDDHAERMRNRRAVVGDRIVPIPRSAPTTFGALLVENYVTTPATSMTRRSALDAAGDFDPNLKLCEDWDMNLRVARLGDFVFVDEILLSWRRHSTAISNVSTRWRQAYLATRYKTIYAPENTAEQRKAAKIALREELLNLRNDAIQKALRGDLRGVPKKLARLTLLASVYFGFFRPRPH